MPLQHFVWASSLLLTKGVAAAAVPQTSENGGNRWVNLTSLPSPRQEHITVAVDNNTIAVIGGVEPLGNDSVQTGLQTTALVQLYDIPCNSWRTVAPLPVKVNHPNAAAVDGRIYLLGGLVDAQNPPRPGADWITTGLSYVYDLKVDRWSDLPSMFNGTERGSAVLGVYGEMIYLAGGMTILRQNYQDAVTSVIAFNTTSRQWQRVPSAAANIPEGRQHAAGGVVGHTLYVIGGRWFERTNVRDDVFSLDLLDQSAGWKTNPGHMPTARGCVTGGAVGDSFFALGGECNNITSNGIFPQAEAYDLAERKWTKLPDMAVPRHGTSAVTVGNRIYVPWGGLQQDGLPVERNGVVSYGQSTSHFDAYEVDGQ